jgi:pyruvate dehydrogenase E2 component (dihydrolipoamide acetyltransferase)
MAIRVLMPKLSFIVTQGTILEWLKKPGDLVTKGEPLLVTESEKATVEIEAPGTGILGPDLAPPGTTVPVTTTIGYILEPGEEPPKLTLDLEALSERSTEASTASSSPPVPTGGAGGGEKQADGRIKASPSAKRLARERGIDLSRIEGSGPQGRIVKQDVLAYAATKAVDVQVQGERASLRTADGRARVTPAARRLASALGIDLSGVEGTGPGGRVRLEDVKRVSQAAPPSSWEEGLGEGGAEGPPAERVALTSIQRIAAERMSLSFRTAPHFYLSVQVDMSQVVSMREELLPTVEARTGLRLSFSDILVCAVARMLKRHPLLNAAFEEDQLNRYQEVNVGLAVDTARGLVVPVFHEADGLSLAEVTRRRAEVVDRARNNRLTPDDISGGTFTVSNLGMFGVDVFSAIINPPQAAILAVGRISKQPVVVEADDGRPDVLQVRPTMWMTLSVDHRASDGATAARFLQDLVGYLKNPRQMLT